MSSLFTPHTVKTMVRLIAVVVVLFVINNVFA